MCFGGNWRISTAISVRRFHQSVPVKGGRRGGGRKKSNYASYMCVVLNQARLTLCSLLNYESGDPICLSVSLRLCSAAGALSLDYSPEVLSWSHHEADDPSFHNITFSVRANTHYQTPVRLLGLRTDEEEPSCTGTENDPLLVTFPFFVFLLFNGDRNVTLMLLRHPRN